MRAAAANGIAIALAVCMILAMISIYRAINPTGANHIVLINSDSAEELSVNLAIHDLNNIILYQHTVMLSRTTNGRVLHYDRAWMGEQVVLRHDGIVERTKISSSGRYSPTLFVEIHRNAASQAGWNQIPSLADPGKIRPSDAPNGADNIFIFERPS